jgi:hypothetical protein
VWRKLSCNCTGGEADFAKHCIPDGTVRHCALTRLTPQKPRGRHPLLSTPLRQRLVSYATASHEQRLKPLRQIAHELNINVGERTLTKAFAKKGYHRRVATEKPLLTPKHMHINDRLWWAATCAALPQLIWNRVIWSDEASFRIERGKVYITRRAEEKYLGLVLVEMAQRALSSCGIERSGVTLPQPRTSSA